MSRESDTDLVHLLADYLGNEMDAAERDRFEQRLADDPALAGEVGDLQRTLAGLRALDEDAMEPAGSLRPASQRTSAWRYAAVIAIAFLGGWAVRAMLNPSEAPTPTGPTSDDAWQTAVVAAWNDRPQASALTRSLVAFGRATSAAKTN